MIKKIVTFLVSALLLSSCSEESEPHFLTLNTYHIYCDSSEFDSIHKNFRENTYIDAIVKKNDTIRKATLRLRGDSSREYPKKSLKVKITDGMPLFETKKFNFNAEYKDLSFSHSYLSSLVFKEIGYPCFASSYAKLFVNNSFHGLFLEIENMDKDFLIRNGFNPKGDLFKATKDGACLFSVNEVDSKWEKKTNKKSSWQPLLKLIEQINSVDDENFFVFINENFNYTKLIDYLAVNIFIANGSTNYHNYYLYRDADRGGKWILFPWDLDKTLSYYDWEPFAYHRTSSDWENDNPLIERCYLNEFIYNDVKQRLLSFKDVLGTEFYEPIYSEIQTIVKKVVLEDKTDKVNSGEEWFKAISHELEFLKNRYKKALESMEAFPLSFKVHETASQLSRPFYFSWDRKADSNLVSYEVYLSKDFLYQDSLTTRIYKTTENSIKIDEDLDLGKYYWKVVAVKDGLKCDGFNSKNSFDLRMGTELPTWINESTTLTSENSPYRIPDSLIIKNNVMLSVEEGVVLLANQNAKINVYGGVNFHGSASNIIKLRPIKPNGFFRSINFYSNNIESKISNVLIKEGGIIGESCMLTINNTRFEIDNRIPQVRENGPCVILVNGGVVKIDSIQMYGNKNGQGMNIISSNVSVTNSLFYNMPDAIEYVNVKNGFIANNYIKNSPDDGIDLNGCEDVTIRDNVIINTKDKGISIGATSERISSGILLLNNYVFNNGIALSVKDNSKVDSKGNYYAYNNIGMQAYRKNTWHNRDIGGYIYSRNDFFKQNIDNEYVDEYSNIDMKFIKKESTIYKDNTTYFIPHELSYEILDGIINIHNNSFFEMNLQDWTLLINDGADEINFTKNECIASKGLLQISASELHRDKQFNYMFFPNLEVNFNTGLSLEDFNGNTYNLRKLDQ